MKSKKNSKKKKKKLLPAKRAEPILKKNFFFKFLKKKSTTFTTFRVRFSSKVGQGQPKSYHSVSAGLVNDHVRYRPPTLESVRDIAEMELFLTFFYSGDLKN